MSIGLGIGLVLLGIVLGGAVFWFANTAREMFRDECDEHARGE